MKEKLNYEVVGEESLPAMLMVHGMLSSNYQWANNRDFLSQHFRLVMVELWGHGDSPSPKEKANYSADGYIQQLEYIREKINIENWIAVGQSFGAGVVMKYALRYPDRVSKLVLTNSKLGMGHLAETTFPKGSLPPLKSLPIHPIHAKRLPAEVREKLVIEADRVNEDAVQIGVGQRHTLGCRNDLHKIKCPTLLCQGIYEKKFQEPTEHAQANMPNLKIVKMEAGHNPNRDTPKEFNEAVLDFCKN